jgi:hypothetical protein
MRHRLGDLGQTGAGRAMRGERAQHVETLLG